MPSLLGQLHEFALWQTITFTNHHHARAQTIAEYGLGTVVPADGDATEEAFTERVTAMVYHCILRSRCSGFLDLPSW